MALSILLYFRGAVGLDGLRGWDHHHYHEHQFYHYRAVRRERERKITSAPRKAKYINKQHTNKFIKRPNFDNNNFKPLLPPQHPLYLLSPRCPFPYCCPRSVPRALPMLLCSRFDWLGFSFFRGFIAGFGAGLAAAVFAAVFAAAACEAAELAAAEAIFAAAVLAVVLAVAGSDGCSGGSNGSPDAGLSPPLPVSPPRFPRHRSRS